MTKILFLCTCIMFLCAGIILGTAISTFVILRPDRLPSWLFPPGVTNVPSSSGAVLTPSSPGDEQKVLQEKIDALKEKLEGYNKRADDLQRLLTVLVGFSTIYAAALTLFALKQAHDSADELQKLTLKAEGDVQEAIQEIQSIFPLVSRMSANFNATVGELLRILPAVDKTDPKYRELEPAEGEQIRFYEKTFAATEYFNLKHFTKDASKIYQGLGNFYAISARKSWEESEGATDPIEKLRLNQNYKGQLARARFYLDQAISKKFDPENTGALNDRAYIELSIAAPPDRLWDIAKDCCRRSVEKDSYQQRARFNLGWLKLTHAPKDYATSVRLFREANDKPRWQQVEPARRIAEILYNKACALVGKAHESTVPDVRSQCLDEAMSDLEEAFSRADRTDREDNEMRKALCGADTTPPDGDLVFLMQNLKSRFDVLVQKVCGSAKSP